MGDRNGDKRTQKKEKKQKCKLLLFQYYKIHSNFKGKIGISGLWLLVRR